MYHAYYTCLQVWGIVYFEFGYPRASKRNKQLAPHFLLLLTYCIGACNPNDPKTMIKTKDPETIQTVFENLKNDPTYGCIITESKQDE